MCRSPDGGAAAFTRAALSAYLKAYPLLAPSAAAGASRAVVETPDAAAAASAASASMPCLSAGAALSLHLKADFTARTQASAADLLLMNPADSAAADAATAATTVDGAPAAPAFAAFLLHLLPPLPRTAALATASATVASAAGAPAGLTSAATGPGVGPNTGAGAGVLLVSADAVGAAASALARRHQLPELAALRAWPGWAVLAAPPPLAPEDIVAAVDTDTPTAAGAADAHAGADADADEGSFGGAAAASASRSSLASVPVAAVARVVVGELRAGADRRAVQLWQSTLASVAAASQVAPPLQQASASGDSAVPAPAPADPSVGDAPAASQQQQQQQQQVSWAAAVSAVLARYSPRQPLSGAGAGAGAETAGTHANADMDANAAAATTGREAAAFPRAPPASEPAPESATLPPSTWAWSRAIARATVNTFISTPLPAAALAVADTADAAAAAVAVPGSTSSAGVPASLAAAPAGGKRRFADTRTTLPSGAHGLRACRETLAVARLLTAASVLPQAIAVAEANGEPLPRPLLPASALAPPPAWERTFARAHSYAPAHSPTPEDAASLCALATLSALPMPVRARLRLEAGDVASVLTAAHRALTGLERAHPSFAFSSAAVGSAGEHMHTPAALSAAAAAATAAGSGGPVTSAARKAALAASAEAAALALWLSAVVAAEADVTAAVTPGSDGGADGNTDGGGDGGYGGGAGSGVGGDRATLTTFTRRFPPYTHIRHWHEAPYLTEFARRVRAKAEHVRRLYK
jgi:hypothetical protein